MHFFYIHVIITHGQNIQNGRKKEQFFSPRSCGVSFLPWELPRAFLLLPITPLLQGANHCRWITDHTVNRRADLTLECADGLRSDVAIRRGFCPFLHFLDQCGSARQFCGPLSHCNAGTVFPIGCWLVADPAILGVPKISCRRSVNSEPQTPSTAMVCFLASFCGVAVPP